MPLSTHCQSESDIIRRSGLVLAVMLLSASVAACSSGKPRLGDTIRAQGNELSAIGDRWTEGDDLIDNGHEKVEDGQEMIAEGNALISEGKALVELGGDDLTRGQQMKQQAEATYRSQTGLELPTTE